MTYNEYEGIMSGLGLAYNKEYKEQELKMFYRFFKDYSTDIFIKSVDDIITNNDKLPSLKQIIDKCELNNQSYLWEKQYKELPKAVEDQEWYDLLNSFH